MVYTTKLITTKYYVQTILCFNFIDTAKVFHSSMLESWHCLGSGCLQAAFNTHE